MTKPTLSQEIPGEFNEKLFYEISVGGPKKSTKKREYL